MNKRTKKRIKTAGKIFFVLYILALIYFLFISERVGQLRFEEREYHYNLILFREISRFWNYREQLGYLAVAANLPFGLILPIISRNARGFFFITFSGFALSLLVETVQLVTKRGSFDVDDLVMNTLGTAAGYVIFAVSYMIYNKLRKRKRKYGKKKV